MHANPSQMRVSALDRISRHELMDEMWEALEDDFRSQAADERDMKHAGHDS